MGQEIRAGRILGAACRRESAWGEKCGTKPILDKWFICSMASEASGKRRCPNAKCAERNQFSGKWLVCSVSYFALGHGASCPSAETVARTLRGSQGQFT